MKQEEKQPKTVHEVLLESVQHDCDAINKQLDYWGAPYEFEVVGELFPTLKLKSN